MIGEASSGLPNAILGIWGILFDGHLWVLLVTQATCCVAAGLAASYFWQHQAARAHRVLLVSLLASVVMPASYLCVRHLGLGMLTPCQATGEGWEAGGDYSLQPAAYSLSAEADEESLFEDSLIFDPTEPDFMDAASVGSSATGVGSSWAMLLILCSFVMSMMLFGRLLRQFLLGHRLLNRAQRVEADSIHIALEQAKARIGIRRAVRLRSCRDVRSPLIWCWRRVPVLLIHEQTGLHAPHCDWVGIFCHELAHWKRLDHISGLFCELLLCAAPWHPLLWWARSRLVTLSEEACDDWVLAAGQTGVDYAESLLDLSPQRQMAFLPTVVGKEKAMKERICRIVKDQCGNPRAGARWAMVVSAVAICTSVTVALAQPRPFAPEPVGPPQAGQPMPPRPLLPPAQRELVIEARRNVLNRMLDNLREQQRRTETALRERGDAQDDNTVILRSELMVIRNHIQAIERQLENVAQPPALRPAPGAGPRGQQPAAVIGQRLPRLQNRITEAEATLKQLEADGQGDSEQARTIRENLRQAREQMQGIRGQLNPMPLDREVGPTQPFQPVPMRLPAEPAPLRPAPGPGRPQIELQNQVQQLQNQMNNMNQQMQQMQRLLEQLVAQRNAGQPPRN